ncbi:MAG: T9SS type A sorting domain-containing protein, partial [Fibrobacteres bacterium]|nr:T9SS type A sorting domain-containing protein [Fibrobacterota bacterium]
NVTGITGHDKLYPIPLGAYSANCWCRLPTFDIDSYDRLCVPSAVTQEVRIADNNGNEIVKFGNYGNWDENGASFPMAFPTGVAATDDYIYVSDLVNGRLLRIKKNFAADNMPGFTTGADKKAVLSTSITTTIAPNPFTQTAIISFNGLANTNATAAIYNAAGVKIKTLFAGITLNGALKLAWDGKNETGNSAAEGVYFIKLVQGGKKLTSRILLTK